MAIERRQQRFALKRAQRPAPVDGLVVSGLAEVAVGALSGWPFALAVADPQRVKALGVRSPRRLRQWHFDLLALGGLTVLAGTAVPSLPARVAWPLGIGAWTNAMAFAVLMVRPDAETGMPYRVGVTGSFAVTTVGFVGLATEAFKRWRGR
ncbi:MAG: hypothetical protein QOG63_1932 [Thermoleophilaceae bacterium]|jgi:hypothetical protein|nr:hypothetical protein [Thermoleophilaceae bacterium]